MTIGDKIQKRGTTSMGEVEKLSGDWVWCKWIKYDARPPLICHAKELQVIK